jgi:hypothetical protein
MLRPSARSPETGADPEWELLLCSARTSMDEGHAGRIQELLGGGIHWKRLVKLAIDHHVTPMLYRGLATVCPDAVPVAILYLLERTFAVNAARNRALASELIELLRWLEAQGIPAIPFKGPTLASLAYGGLELRQAGDLDVLLRRRDASRAKSMLMSRGFRPYYDSSDDLLLGRSHHFRLDRQGDPLTIEIHWRLIEDHFCFNLGEEALWRNAPSVRLAGVQVPCFPTTELVLYLCAHGAKHNWQRLSWICDIAELIRSQPGLDWELVRHRARAIGAGRMLSLALLLARDLLGAPIAECIAGGIDADATARELAREVRERHLPLAEKEQDFAEVCAFNIRARERRRDRLRCRARLTAFGLRPNERDHAFLHLPRPLAFLYHGVKPVRLAGKYASNPSTFLRMVGGMMGITSGRPRARDGAGIGIGHSNSQS